MAIFTTTAAKVTAALTAVTTIATSVAGISLVNLQTANQNLDVVQEKVDKLTTNETKYKKMIDDLEKNGDKQIKDIIYAGQMTINGLEAGIEDASNKLTEKNTKTNKTAEETINEVNSAIEETKEKVNKLKSSTQNVEEVKDTDVKAAEERFTDKDAELNKLLKP